jgi:hypothetical protein
MGKSFDSKGFTNYNISANKTFQFYLDSNVKVFTFVNFLLALILYIYWSYVIKFGIYFRNYSDRPEAIVALHHFSELSILFLTLFLISLYNLVYIYFGNLKFRLFASIFVSSFFIFVLIKLILTVRDIYIGSIHILVTSKGVVENVRAEIFTESMYYSSVAFMLIIFIMLIMFLKNSFSESYKENFIKKNVIYLLAITTVAVVSTILTATDIFNFYPILIPDVYNYLSYIIIFIPFYISLILFFKYFNKEKISIIFSILAFYPVFIFTFPILISSLIAGKGYYGPAGLTFYDIMHSVVFLISYFFERFFDLLPYLFFFTYLQFVFIFTFPPLWLILYLFFRKRAPFLIMILLLNLLLILYYSGVYPFTLPIYYSFKLGLYALRVPPFYLYNTNPMREFLEFFNISIGILVLINLMILLLGAYYKRRISSRKGSR